MEWNFGPMRFHYGRGHTAGLHRDWLCAVKGTTVGGKGSSERRVVVFMNIVKSIIEL